VSLGPLSVNRLLTFRIVLCATARVWSVRTILIVRGMGTVIARMRVDAGRECRVRAAANITSIRGVSFALWATANLNGGVVGEGARDRMGKGRSKGGRRRKVLVLREPNGRAVRKSQAEQERDTRSVCVEARQRVYGLTENAAKDKEAGYALGRLFMAGEITKEQALAGEEYERICRSYDRAMVARGVRSASDFAGPGGYDGDDGTDEGYVKACNAARSKWAESQHALMHASEQTLDAYVTYAVNSWAADNNEAWGFLGSLRTGLNALAKLYRVEEWLSKDRSKAA
jgi:hypothetical protein